MKRITIIVMTTAVPTTTVLTPTSTQITTIVLLLAGTVIRIIKGMQK